MALQFLALNGQQAPLALDLEAAAALKAHDWPGNVRELRNTVQRGIASALERAGLGAAASIEAVIGLRDIDLIA
jgi:DNA-binding NtrC family response regulator